MTERIGQFARLDFPEEWPPEKRAEVYAKYQQAEGRGPNEKDRSKDVESQNARRTSHDGETEGKKIRR